MKKRRQVPLMLSIPVIYRDKLRVMAAQQNLKDPSQVTTASTIAKEIVCNILKKMEDGNGDT